MLMKILQPFVVLPMLLEQFALLLFGDTRIRHESLDNAFVVLICLIVEFRANRCYRFDVAYRYIEKAWEGLDTELSTLL